ncbi:hypothetical protein D9Q98_001283 [Chlorella vulgaris]|uniref:Uncharacterized protein n=1 Tax=Chlorella vulgaris TaxID=3077 RepID=A0A9D4U015_CHLVU|nr:hypothetical protein D9Q98_001283 [Chlorella vulgaris]
MFSRSSTHHSDQQHVNDSLDDEGAWEVVYDDPATDRGRDNSQEGRARRPRYVLPLASSAAQGMSAAPRSANEPALAASRGAVDAPVVQVAEQGGSPGTSPARRAVLNGPGEQQQSTLAQELQTVLTGLMQQQPAAQSGHEQAQLPHTVEDRQHLQQLHPEQAEAEEELLARRRRSGMRQIRHVSPSVPPLLGTLQQAGAGAGAGTEASAGTGPASGRRWRPAQPAVAGSLAGQRFFPAQQVHPVDAAAAGIDHPTAFFEVDSDLLVAHEQQRALQVGPGHAPRQQQQRRKPQQKRVVQWDSPQAVQQQQQQHVSERTPQAQPGVNPLAALLGGGGTPANTGRPRPAARLRGRHPIYGTAAPAMLASVAPPADVRQQEAACSSGPPLISPHHPVGQHRQQPAQQASRFAIRDAVAGAALQGGCSQQPAAAGTQGGAAADAGTGGGVAGSAFGLKLLTGGEPQSAQRQQQFHPRPRRPASPGEWIEEEQVQAQTQAQDQQPQQSQHQQQEEGSWAGGEDVGGPQGDAFRTPGQPLRRSRQAQEAGQQQPGTEGPPHTEGRFEAAAAPHSASIGSPGSTGGKALALQRQFIAQLQPVSRPAAAATMQQQRQRLAGAAGLHARMQAILAAERAQLAALQSPSGGVPAGPRLTVLSKVLEAGLTKCHCRCDQAAAAALASSEVLALLQNRAAREVDTAPGSVILLREPWRRVEVTGSPCPVVLCFAVCIG